MRQSARRTFSSTWDWRSRRSTVRLIHAMAAKPMITQRLKMSQSKPRRIYSSLNM
jgi:hypothetical protein